MCSKKDVVDTEKSENEVERSHQEAKSDTEKDKEETEAKEDTPNRIWRLNDRTSISNDDLRSTSDRRI